MSEIKAAPIVRKLAQENDVNLSEITGTGKNGFITKADYERHTGTAAPAKRQDARAPLNHLTGDDEVEIGGITFRKSRGGFDHSTRQALRVDEKLLNKDLEYRWVNDDNGRVEKARDLGYEVVDSKALGDEKVSVQRRVGTKKDGSHMNAVLMATPKDWKKKRHKKAEQERSEKEMGMFKKPVDDSGRPLGDDFYKKRDVDSGYRENA